MIIIFLKMLFTIIPLKKKFFFCFSCHLDGKCLACTFRAKFIEVSVGINHNVDELLAGTLTQIRLKKEQNMLQVSYFNLFYFLRPLLYKKDILNLIYI